MTNLVGRIAQIKKLEKLKTSKQAEFLVIYGRRRVGKTFLAREYFKRDLVFDFTGAYQVDKQTQLEHFFSEYLSRTKATKETTLPHNWSEAFRYLAEYLESLSKHKKSVVFIDELPWLDTHKSGFVASLEYFWNQYVAKMDHIILVVCGSANAWIQKKIFQSKGGLYNRVTQRIKLQPFTLSETQALFKSRNIQLTPYQIIQLYMCMGGIPHYLKEVIKGQSAVQAIDAICFSAEGLLQSEFDQLYPSIFNQVENHLAIIEALSTKPHGMTRGQLIATSGLPDGGIFTRTTNELLEADFISLQLPFDKKKKNALYKLSDLYSLFYFKFIKNNRRNGSGTWKRLSQTPSYKAWSGYAFENICMSHLAQIKKAIGISGIYAHASSWKYKGDDTLPGSQIDLLLDRDDLCINICEAKFSQDPFVITKSYAQKIRERNMIFKQVTKTNKQIHNTLITTYPVVQNGHYHELIQSEINMENLFDE